MKILLSDKRFLSLLKRHCYEIIKVLMDKRINFSIVCSVACVKFEPPLPNQIYDTFNDLTMFILHLNKHLELCVSHVCQSGC